MPSQYLVTGLLQALRDTGTIPESDEGTSTTRLLAFMNREQRGYLMGLLLKAREDFATYSVDTALVSGQTRYRIPTRAVAAALQLVELVVADGNTVPLQRVPRNRLLEQRVAGYSAAYYLDGNEIVLASALTGTMRTTYSRRFNRLVRADEAGEVESFDTGAKTVELVTAPSGFDGATSFDIIQGSPHFDTLGAERAATLVGTTLTFAEDLPDDIAAGDYVALAGETPICQAPLEFHDVLTQRACFKYLEAKSDPGTAAAKTTLDEMAAAAISLVTPRVQQQSEVLVDYSGPGWNRGLRGRGRWR